MLARAWQPEAPSKLQSAETQGRHIEACSCWKRAAGLSWHRPPSVSRPPTPLSVTKPICRPAIAQLALPWAHRSHAGAVLASALPARRACAWGMGYQLCLAQKCTTRQQAAPDSLHLCRSCPGQYATHALSCARGTGAVSCIWLRIAEQAAGGSRLMCRCRPGQCTAHLLSTVPGASSRRQWPAQGWGTGALRYSWPGSGSSGCLL